MNDLQTFFKQDAQRIRDPGLAASAANVQDDLRAVCSDAEHIRDNPHMIRVCCPPMRRLPKHALPELKSAYLAQVDHCYRVNSGWGYDGETVNRFEKQKLAYETRQRQNRMDSVVREACRDGDFAKAHADYCCVAPGFNLGFPHDSAPVAHACGLAQM